MSRREKAHLSLLPRLRVLRNEEVALGPGKIELLKTIQRTGSIAQAARELGMSYMRAWSLIKTMNASFKAPVVDALRGGKKHGGAMLTETGRKVLSLYEQMERNTIVAARSPWNRLKSLLR